MSDGFVPKPGVVYRRDYVAKEDELAHLREGADGLPLLRLVFFTDRLVIGAPTADKRDLVLINPKSVIGAPTADKRDLVLINPKSPNLKRLGMFVSYARGSRYHASAFKAAALGPGGRVELRRDPGNEHDPNAVQMLAPGARKPFAYVQKGKAGPVAALLDAGEDLAGVSLRGPGAGLDDDTAFILIGPRAALAKMAADTAPVTLVRHS